MNITKCYNGIHLKLDRIATCPRREVDFIQNDFHDNWQKYEEGGSERYGGKPVSILLAGGKTA
jgi:hypothetical protein